MKRIVTSLFLFLFLSSQASENSFYWIGGTGNWNDLNHWVTESGGPVHPVVLPGSADDVFFDANSFNETGQVVTLTAGAICRNMNWTGVTYCPTLEFAGSSAYAVGIYGSLTLVNGMNVTYPFTSVKWEFRSVSPGNTVTTGGKEMRDVVFGGPGGEWTLQDNLNAGAAVSVSAGTLNTSNADIFTSIFNANAGVINMGTSEINCSLWLASITGAVTLNPGTSFIKTGEIISARLHYYNVMIIGGVGTVDVSLSYDSFNDLVINTSNTTSLMGSLGHPGSGAIYVSSNFIIKGPAKTVFWDPTVGITVGKSFGILPSTGNTIIFQSQAYSPVMISSGSASCLGNAIIRGIAPAGGPFYLYNSTLEGFNPGNWVVTYTPCNLILPVRLLSFELTCTSGNILFTWKTASEINSSHFEIQKQVTTGWTGIGTVAASGESQSERIYHFQSGEEVGIFRLASVDRDGKMSYSAIKTIQCGQNANIVIAPNPIRHILELRIKSNKNEPMQLQIINVMGQIVRKEQVVVVTGINLFKLDLTPIVSGVYILNVQSKGIKIPFVKEL
ncbi:MAG: T9SS type A sorting domain-containing protein [Chitinophagaceae bacterium]|nr:T9SS type A sorting domain-containing protein [Chitinophagaceae bacterium]